MQHCARCREDYCKSCIIHKLRIKEEAGLEEDEPIDTNVADEKGEKMGTEGTEDARGKVNKAN